jgi:hypothetical protein
MERIIPIEKLTLREMINNFHLYNALPDGLSQLPVPETIKIRKKEYNVPQTLKEFTDNICYGQRLFLVREEKNDFGAIIRVIDGYYYPLVTVNKWDEDKALLFGKNVLICTVKDLYPVAMHLVTLISEMVKREQELLHREPSKIEKAAGIDKLNVFSELTSLDFLRDAMKCTVPEVLLTPYNECLVRFMIAKETAEFQERYYELVQNVNSPKSKYKQNQL